MDPKLDLQSLHNIYSYSPLYLASHSPLSKFSPKTDSPLTHSIRKRLDSASLRDFKAYPLAPKLNQSSHRTQDESYLKKIIKSSSISGNKQALLYKISQRNKKLRYQKVENPETKGQIQDAVYIEPINIRSKDQGDTKSLSQSRPIASSVDPQVNSVKKEKANSALQDAFSKKAQDNYTHFKKTMSSFWVKSNGNSGMTSPNNQKTSSEVRPKTVQIGINASRRSKIKIPNDSEIDKKDTTNILSPDHKRQFLALSKVDIGEKTEKIPKKWADLTLPTPAYFTGNLTRFIEKADFASIDMGYDDERRKEIFGSESVIEEDNMRIKQSELRPNNEEDITISFRKYAKDSARLGFPVRNAEDPENMKNSANKLNSQNYFKHKRIIENMHNENQNDNKVSPSSSYRGIQMNLSSVKSAPQSLIYIKSMQNKLKETLNPKLLVKSPKTKVSRKSEYITINENESLQDKLGDSSIKPNISVDKKISFRARAGTASITFNKREKNCIDKSPKLSTNYTSALFKDIETFELKGWGQEGDGQNDF